MRKVVNPRSINKVQPKNPICNCELLQVFARNGEKGRKEVDGDGTEN